VKDLERIRTDRVIGRRAPKQDPVLAAARGCWQAVVGATVARHAMPVRVSGETLVVACSSASWSSELTLLAPTVGARLQAELGRELGLRFEVGELPVSPDPPAPPPRPPRAPDAAERARRLTAGVGSDELRASLEQAIARTLLG
jgi:hypothetical protein